MTYDLGGTQDAMTRVKTSVASIVPYILAVINLPLGPQKIVVDGDAVGSWSPFAQSPGLAQSLGAIQQHCVDFQSAVLTGLHAFPPLLAYSQGNGNGVGVQSDLSSILSIISQLEGSNETPSATQRQTVMTALANLNLWMSMICGLLAGLPQSTATFLSQTAGDVQTLSEGSFRINTIINEVQQAYLSAAEQYGGGGAAGAAIDEVLSDITGQMITSLLAIQTAMSRALADEQPIPGALTNLQGVFTTLRSDYSSTTESIDSASDAAFASTLQLLDVQNAQSYWQNATSFAIANGLGC